MFENIKNLGNMMKMAGEARQRMEQVKQALDQRRVEGEAGGGAVRVTLNGRGVALRVDIDEPMLAGLGGADKTLVEELIAGAFNAAHEKLAEVLQEEIAKATEGMDLPPEIGKMLGGGGM